MTLRGIYAHLNCSSLGESIAWFQKLFGRPPDAHPMDGLAEWHHGDIAGFQLFENPNDSGRGTLTLIVDGLNEEKARLETGGLEVGEVEQANHASLIRLRDPDGNLVVMAQPD